MSRQLYENETNRNNEQAAKVTLEASWSVTLRKLPIKYGAEWVAFRGDQAVAVIEYKNRPHDSTRFPTYLLSVHKWMSMRSLANTIGVPAILVVEFVDGMRHCTLEDEMATTAWAGRRDRGDADDLEPCMMIPMDRFGYIR